MAISANVPMATTAAAAVGPSLDTATVPSSASAREWWNQREIKAEKELAIGLQKRLDAQRAQIQAFKHDQSKWEHELQLRISKYAHDRKLLSEHNIELQQALTALEEKFERQQQDMDRLTSRIVELEGLLHEKQHEARTVADLKQENTELHERLAQWEECHQADVTAALRNQEARHQQVLDQLQARLQRALKENCDLKQCCETLQERLSRRDIPCSASAATEWKVEDDIYFLQAGDFEKLCRQKIDRLMRKQDQTIHSLKLMLERHQTMSEEKMKILSSKYDQMKAINVALQV
ncbi:TPA: hypothetical protein N0F65_003822 [Lagenidium giganteum]|uniref:Uncharacterized protein n=1 Tax=Lagenidium giganteum TaxID=4803 RepID=A0AAV2YV16_9STRA|nr:TPA: hypothetical protein N0F65_003822 [Lagenidium giganteum]